MTGRSKVRRAALGFRAHSGWACAILIAGTKANPDVVERRRIVLCDSAIAGSKQPFHQAEPMRFADAQTYIARCTRSTDALTRAALGQLRAFAERGETQIVGCGLTTASGRPLPDLKAILASHSLIHAAEGEFYRDAVARACAAAGIPVARVKEREVADWTAARLNLTDAGLRERLAAFGKALGPPWTADEKLATMAAWLALAA
jgi:hypothetical protein